jgi:3-phenylpropionate/cinnamic acid dioxygenase small subunit
MVVNKNEERLQYLLDLEEIRSLLLEYGTTLDNRDLAAYSRLFAQNGKWTGPFVGSATGPAAILALLEKNLPAVAGEKPSGAHHLMTNMRIEMDGDRATAWSRWTYIVPGPKREPTLLLSGHYDDVLAREGGRWRFQSRVVSGDLPGEDP